MEQSKQISTLSAAIQNTILWDSTCPRPAASSTPSPLWTEVVVRNRNGLHGRCSSPRLNLANKLSVLSEVGSQTGAPEAALRPTFQADSSASSRQMTKTKAVTRRSSACVTHTAATATSHLEPRQPMHGPTVSPAKQTPAAVDAPAATTSRRTPPPPSLPAAQVGDRPVSRRLQPSGSSAPPVCIGAAAGGVLSPTGDSADWPVVTRADCRSQCESISARRQLLRNAVRRRPGSLPAPAICLQNPGSTSPVEPSAAAPVAAHRPTIPCASGLAGRKGVVQQQHRGPRPASPQLTPSPPSTIILGDSIIRNVSIFNARTMVFPGATVVDITDKIQEVAMSFPSADSLLLYVGTNDVGKRQSELLKSDFIRLFSVLKPVLYSSEVEILRYCT